MWQEYTGELDEPETDMDYQKIMLSGFNRLVPNFNIDTLACPFRPPYPNGIRYFINNGKFDEEFVIISGNLVNFSDDFVANNRELLEFMFANMFIHINNPEEMILIDETTHSGIIGLLRNCNRLVIDERLADQSRLDHDTFYPKWALELNYFILKGIYNPKLKFRILDVSLEACEAIPINTGTVRFLKHFNIGKQLDCRGLFSDLIHCVYCKNESVISLSFDFKYLKFDPSIIDMGDDIGLVETGKVRATTAILDRAIEAYDRFNSRGDRTKKAL